MSNDAELWDAAADRFDDEPDHGLLDPQRRAAWLAWLRELLPEPPASVLDIGCGTGTLSVLLAQDGYDVTGIDSSERMLERARSKAGAAGLAIEFAQADANSLDLPLAGFDAIVVRHVLWAMTDAASALANWIERLRAGGAIILIEGHWLTGAGIPAEQCLALAREAIPDARLLPMSDPVFWGGATHDERYTVVGRRS
jgi:ubiquinone/menaquinone biosynthesis C-methylase UbiE